MLAWRHTGTDPFTLYHSGRREGKEALGPQDRSRYRSFMLACAVKAHEGHVRELGSIMGGSGTTEEETASKKRQLRRRQGRRGGR